MKRYIYMILCSIVSLWGFSSCEDYTFDDIPDPVVPEDMTTGLKLSKNKVMIDAMGNAQGFELRAIGGKWTIEPEKPTDWLLDYEPKSGDEGNSIIGVTLRVNEGMQERFVKFIIKQEDTGAVDTVQVGQYTYESSYTRKTDSLALVALYNAFNGEKWRRPWNLRKPITEWSGIVLGEVNGEQRVVGLVLTDFQLSGEMPNEIGNLRELTSIRIGGKVLGRVPNSLINLRKLESFTVNFSDGAEWFLPDDMSTMLSLKEFKPGPLKISMTSFAALYTLPVLETLELSSIYILGDLPAGISKLKHLTTLSLGGTNLYHLPEDIGELAGTLTSLDLGRCASLVSLGDDFGKLVNLTELMLNGCKVLQELPEGFGNLSKLTSLDLSECERLKKLSDDIGNLNISSIVFSACKSLEELPESFSQLTLLTELNMRECEKLERLPESLGNIVDIRNLNFYGCSALKELPESIGQMEKVTEIDLGYCKALTSLPNGIGVMKGLKKLTLTSTGLTAIPAVLSNLETLEELDVTGSGNGPGISGVAAEAFGGMTGLTRLTASYNSFTGDLAWVKNLPKLQALEMQNNQLSGVIRLDDFGSEFTDIRLAYNKLEGNLNGISKLKKVRNFYLNNNLLSGILPAEMGDCTAMSYMDLNTNNITGTIPVELTKMNLGYSGLNVSQNRMSGVIPAAVLSSAIWKKLYPATNIYPQQEGYGFTNVP